MGFGSKLAAIAMLCVLAGCQTPPSVRPDGVAVNFAAPSPNLPRIDVPEPAPEPITRRRNLAATGARPVAYVEPAAAPPEPDVLVAPTPTPTSASVTLDELQQSALANNPTLRMAATQIEKELGNRLQVGLWPNPVAGYLRSDPDSPGQSRTSGGFIQQTFVTAGKLRLAREQEDFGIKDAMQGLEAQKHRVLNDVRIRYYEALGAQHTAAVARDVEKLVAEGLDVIRRAERAGEAQPVDVVQAEMQLQRVQLAVRAAEAQLSEAWQRLMDMVGTPDLPLRRLAGELEKDLPELDADQQWQLLLSESPLLRQLSAQVGVARKAWELAVAQRIPDITGQVVVERDSTQKFTTVQTLLAVPLPVFNRNQGGIYTAWHELQRVEAEIERTQLALRDAFETSFRRYAAARDRAETIRRDLLPAARKSLELTEQAQAVGELSLTEVLNARQVLFETQLEYSAALTELQVAAAEVEGMQLTGGLNPAEIGTAIQSSAGSTSQRRALQQLLEQQQRGNLKQFTPGTTGE